MELFRHFALMLDLKMNLTSSAVAMWRNDKRYEIVRFAYNCLHLTEQKGAPRAIGSGPGQRRARVGSRPQKRGRQNLLHRRDWRDEPRGRLEEGLQPVSDHVLKECQRGQLQRQLSKLLRQSHEPHM